MAFVGGAREEGWALGWVRMTRAVGVSRGAGSLTTGVGWTVSLSAPAGIGDESGGARLAAPLAAEPLAVK